ncbi:hypothetical protein A3Q56_08580 [Intoshia linei]|uniref:Uncharacterized protein n=1 Tax=Intoshia linei TaxID=1819745 RepID=A0A177ANW7_9BILA|nr:hypothetical protein A3Q56_08580 [Intoshia linei]
MTSRQLDFAVGHYFDYDLNLNKILSRKDVLRRILCLKPSKKVFFFRISSGELSEIYMKTGLNIIGRKRMEDKLRQLYSKYRIGSRRKNTPQCNDFINILSQLFYCHKSDQSKALNEDLLFLEN